jgi:hypothetical protein
LDAQPDPATVVVKRIGWSFEAELIDSGSSFSVMRKSGNALPLFVGRERACQFIRMVLVMLPAIRARLGKTDAYVQISAAVFIDRDSPVVYNLKMPAEKRFSLQRALEDEIHA